MNRQFGRLLSLGGRAVVVAVGLAVVGTAGVIGFRPDRLPDGVLASVTGLTDLELVGLLVGSGAFVALYATFRFRPTVASREPPPVVPDPPELVHEDGDDVVAAPFDGHLDALRAGPDARESSDAARAALREELRETAVVVHARAAGCTREGAEAAVESGEWTDDPRAAAFLGGDAVPDPPLLVRVRDHLSREDATARRVERAVDAMEATAEREWGESP